MMRALAAGGGYVAGYFIPTLAFIAVYYLGRAPSASGHTSTVGDTLMVMYLAAAYALAGGIAYTAIASASRNWRQRPARQAAAISAAVGVAGQILNWTGLSIVALLPLVHVLPRNVTTVLGIAMPGVVCGVAVLIWSAARPAGTPVAGPGADRGS